jgi:hypothetical protein
LLGLRFENREPFRRLEGGRGGKRGLGKWCVKQCKGTEISVRQIGEGHSCKKKRRRKATVEYEIEGCEGCGGPISPVECPVVGCPCATDIVEGKNISVIGKQPGERKKRVSFTSSPQKK